MRRFLVSATALLSAVVADAAAQSTEPAGGGQPHNNLQPSLVLNAVVRTNGGLFEKLGEIKYFAGNFAPAGYQFANGQVLSIEEYTDVWARIGNRYGGDPTATFALPDLRGRVAMHYGEGPDLTPVTLAQAGGTADVSPATTQLPVHTHGAAIIGPTGPAGGGLPHPNQQPYLAVNYRIDLDGVFPQPGTGSGIYDDFLGHIDISAAPTGEFERIASVNGQLVPTNQNQALRQILGTTYGDFGSILVKFPDLQGRVPIGQGAGPGLTARPLASSFGEESHTLTPGEMPTHVHAFPGGGATEPAGGGQPHNNMQPSLAMNYIIAINGLDPTSGGTSLSNFPFMGEVSLFAGTFAPVGWAFPQGQLLAIADHPALYNVLGTTYGGDGVNTFALPDLRGRTIIHSMGTTYELGDVLGEEQHTLTESEMPTHTHSIPEPTALVLALLPVTTLLPRRRRK